MISKMGDNEYQAESWKKTVLKERVKTHRNCNNPSIFTKQLENENAFQMLIK